MKTQPKIIPLMKDNPDAFEILGIPDSEIEQYIQQQTADFDLELLEGITIEDNFFGTPNEIFKLMSITRLASADFCVYFYLYRLSYGWHRNWCRIGHDGLHRALGLSLATVKRSIPELLSRKCIAIIEEDVTSNMGTLYYVYLPDDILAGRVKMTRLKMSRVKMNSVQSEPSKSGQNETGQNEPTSMKNVMNIEDSSGGFKMSRVKMSPIKYSIKNNNKNTLSPDQLIGTFYKGIGQERISKKKRESALAIAKELQEGGFKAEDIEYAIKWTIKNAKEKPYDFAILNHTIGQAIVDKEKEQKREEIQQEIVAEQESLEQEADAMRERKEDMPKNERRQLREQALNEIKADRNIKADFITEPLIESKENEILKRD